MKSKLSVHVDRMAEALARQGTKLKRGAVLEVLASALGYRNGNEAAAAAARGELDPAKAEPVGQAVLADGTVLVLARDPQSGRAYGVCREYLTERRASRRYGTTPYGTLVDVGLIAAGGTEATDAGQSRAEAFKVPLTVHTASIEHRHGSSTYAAPSAADLEAEVAGYCRQWWKKEMRGEALGRNPDELDDADIVREYFNGDDADHDENVSYDTSTVFFSPAALRAALAAAGSDGAKGPILGYQVFRGKQSIQGEEGDPFGLSSFEVIDPACVEKARRMLPATDLALRPVFAGDVENASVVRI